jgi:hypothetical protein
MDKRTANSTISSGLWKMMMVHRYHPLLMITK